MRGSTVALTLMIVWMLVVKCGVVLWGGVRWCVVMWCTSVSVNNYLCNVVIRCSLTYWYIERLYYIKKCKYYINNKPLQNRCENGALCNDGINSYTCSCSKVNYKAPCALYLIMRHKAYIPSSSTSCDNIWSSDWLSIIIACDQYTQFLLSVTASCLCCIFSALYFINRPNPTYLVPILGFVHSWEGF